MSNLSSSIKKFVGNKNTVTILGVLLCILILYFGYSSTINKKVALTKVPYANQTIQPRTEITSDMISYMNVPTSFLVGSYYRSGEDIIGKYPDYNTVIAEGSIFYTDLVVESATLPNSSFLDVAENETVISYKVNMDSTYANSMMPDDYINIYFKARSDENTIMFGKFLSNIKILDVKDSSGRHVFENSQEARTPAYMLFALPEDMHLLFRKAIYLAGSYDVELILVPNTQEVTAEDAVFVSSKDIQDFINEKTEMVSVDEILSSTSDEVSNNETNNQ
ncbi:MAG: hypothetical protein IJ509_03035 [Bacilli bacterium]|nr:hypothetical protein [Bacilli bacterium]